MALIKCSECGKDVSDKAIACPHCGCPQSKTEYIVCDECGGKVEKNIDTCPHCGNPLKEDLSNFVYDNQLLNSAKEIVSQCADKEIAIGKFSTTYNLSREATTKYIDKAYQDIALKLKALQKSNENTTYMKSWDELDSFEKTAINMYRRKTKQWWNFDKILAMAFALLGLIFVIISIQIGSSDWFFLMLGIICIFIGALPPVINSSKEQKAWYNGHKEKLYEDGIIK